MTDEELMASLAQGNQGALAEIMSRYQKDVFRFCLHYLKDVERARDLSQETFIRVYTASGRFDEARKFKPWMLCISRNLCLNELKRRKTVPMESLEEHIEGRADSADILRSSAAAPDEQAMVGERLALLSEVLEGLGDESREIVTLRFFERLSAKEIADIVGSTEGAVRTKLHRILQGLRRDYLDRKDEL